MNLITYFIDIPSEKCAVQVMTQPDVTVDDILFDCLLMFGTDNKPTRVALGTPDNQVWP